jgi:hypothetical protein
VSSNSIVPNRFLGEVSVSRAQNRTADVSQHRADDHVWILICLPGQANQNSALDKSTKRTKNHPKTNENAMTV